MFVLVAFFSVFAIFDMGPRCGLKTFVRSWNGDEKRQLIIDLGISIVQEIV